jgi:hypothetical protein
MKDRLRFCQRSVGGNCRQIVQDQVKLLQGWGVATERLINRQYEKNSPVDRVYKAIGKTTMTRSVVVVFFISGGKQTCKRGTH